jgi:hypothetical protein
MNTSINAPLGKEQEDLNGVTSIEVYNFPTASGIDSLYYFIQSNSAYEAFYHYSIFSVVEQSKDANGGFIPKGSLKIIISDIEFVYYGKEQGFYFFGDDVGMFRVGFKDPKTNTGVQDIRIQLQGLGIYALGLVHLVEYINTNILKEITEPFYFVTRVDLNIFCQFDLGSIIEPEHITTRKRKFSRVIGTKNRYETLYIWKPPARIRIYDKFIELDKTTAKFYFMKLYFEQHGIKVKDPLWNFEIECHRDFLKQYKISTLDDLLGNVQTLFHKCMEQVRLVDISTISKKDFEANRLYKADTHSLWEYLDSSYTFNATKQNTIPLERIVYAPKELTIRDFLQDFRALISKYEEHSVMIDRDSIREIFHESRLWLTKEAKKDIKPFIPIELQTDERNYLLTRNFVAVPTLPASLIPLSDKQLYQLEYLLDKALHQELAKDYQDIGLIAKHTRIVNEEIRRRRVGQKELELWQQ